MYLSRMQVEPEGFLGGLDLQFAPGLNVIIGARGAGKTSVVELVRYCLGIGGFTDDALTKGRQQALAILQGGAVTITVETDDGPVSITRSASGAVTTNTPTLPVCTVLAQNEIEAVGAQSAGRRHLIDRFRPRRETLDASVTQLSLRVRSLTAEVAAALQEGVGLSSQLVNANEVQVELAQARERQQQLLAAANASTEQRTLLTSLETARKSLAARDTFLRQQLDDTGQVASDLALVASSAQNLLRAWPLDAGDPATLGTANGHVATALQHIQNSIQELNAARAALESIRGRDDETRRTVDENSRSVRQQLDTLAAGVGASSRQVQELEERVGQLNAISERLAERRSRFVDLVAQRDALFAQLDDLRQAIFQERVIVADELNAVLSPPIRVRITHNSLIGAYESALISGLRGSGLHYNTLAPQISKSISPYELISWVEQGSVSELAAAAGLSSDRAAAVVSALRSSGTAEIIATQVEDEVTLELLDGREYKQSDRVSIGQRCTAVLPVLLGHHGDPLVMDQPEDHLDNAFIASTLVPSLRRRAGEDQFIFTSHNANIPVLGEADQVIVMESDGDRGFVAESGPLDDTAIVDAVSRILEGGAEAFATRARFYSQAHLLHE